MKTLRSFEEMRETLNKKVVRKFQSRKAKQDTIGAERNRVKDIPRGLKIFRK